ncbi:GNAT family N-acetyltransferase [Salirhabdus sp. Marseille-P4669]|uniref:GNAT family N-acetyltransferase n=1 Tax=Salirhabdus sp. Marseille-P4669 TaxID=2042310 RepID=UPI000C7D456C|nr:GNAT family N-acetyltransferase [Salirhabdus sp. Marseille-P4669]
MIRHAEYKDLSKIMEIENQSREIMQKEGNEQWDESYPLAAHYEGDIKESNLFVYEEDNRILGVACISNYGHQEYNDINWTYNGPYYCIKRLAVDPKTRGKGIALKFYQAAEEIALENGVHLIRTDTYSKNKGAVKLFEKANYEFVQQRINEGKEAPFYYYEKKFK